MTLEPGDPVGDRFVVEALLGEGGTARVYRVRHTTLGSLHALKLLAPESGTSPARLLQEGRIQATLRHPCVVPVTDVVDQDGRLGLIMEYVPGPSLADLLARRSLSEDEALALFSRILAGVGAAHASGVLHRDLKPHNVLLAPLTGGWLPKVADFGIARAVGNTARRTRIGFSIGTPGYMAPEQAMGRADVDQRADVYALGVVLFEMLTGRIPGGDDPTGPLPDELSLRDQLPRGPIAETILAALTTEVASRLPDIPTFARSLYRDHPDLQAVALGQVAASPVPLDEVGGLQLPARTNATLVASLTMEGDHRTYGVPTAAPPVSRAGTSPSLQPTAEAPPPRQTGLGLLLGVGIGGGILLLLGLVATVGYLAGRPTTDRIAAAPVAPEASTAAPPAATVTPPPGAPPGAPAGAAEAAQPEVAAAPTVPPPAAAPPSTLPAAARPGAPPVTPVASPTASPTAPPIESPPPTPAMASVTAPASLAPASVEPAVVAAPATIPDVHGLYVGTAGGRPAQVRLVRGEGGRVTAEVTLTLGITDRTLRYMGSVDSSGALALMEDGGSGRLAGTVRNGVVTGTVSTGGGKPLPLRGTLE